MVIKKRHPAGGTKRVKVPILPENTEATLVLPQFINAINARDSYITALEYSPFGIGFLDDNGGLTQTNRTLSRWLAIPTSSLPSKTLVDFIYEEDRPAFARALQRVIQNGEVYHDMEIRLICNKEKSLWVSVTLNRLPSAHGMQMVVFMTDITRRKKTEEDLRRLATTDHLTGLMNRMSFDEALQRAFKNARRYHRQGAILYIDLNDFKKVNDTYGHKAGDQILQECGKQFTSFFRETDTVARLAGDEFAIIMEEVSATQVKFKAKELELLVKNIKVEAHGKEVSCTASVGLQLFNGDTKDSLEDIIHAADQAMYTQKNAVKKALDS